MFREEQRRIHHLTTRGAGGGTKLQDSATLSPLRPHVMKHSGLLLSRFGTMFWLKIWFFCGPFFGLFLVHFLTNNLYVHMCEDRGYSHMYICTTMVPTKMYICTTNGSRMYICTVICTYAQQHHRSIYVHMHSSITVNLYVHIRNMWWKWLAQKWAKFIQKTNHILVKKSISFWSRFGTLFFRSIVTDAAPRVVK